MKKLAIVLMVMGSLLSKGQNHNRWCGHDAIINDLKSDEVRYKNFIEGRKLQFEIAKNSPARKSAGEVYVIPVVFHVIYWDSSDSVSAAQLQDGLDVLNRDFRRQNPDTVNTRPIFKHLGADVGVEFRLATKDPVGNPTSGIRYIKNNITLRASASVRTIDRWPHERYFNIWVVRRIDDSSNEPGVTTLGYSFIPFPGQTGDYDGMVIRHDQVGRIGTARNSGQGGRTMVHEAGHYLGLSHTFEGGCDTIYWNGGDQIDDTPPVAAPNFSCDFSINSCHADTLNDLPDMVENYMDYAPGTCMNIFTQGQKNVMLASFQNPNLRALLVSESNLDRTGVLGTDEYNEATVGLYPNPTSEHFIIESEKSLMGVEISLLDIRGKQVNQWLVQANTNRFVVDLENDLVGKGVYLVSLKNLYDNKQPVVRKLLIQ